MRVELPFLPWRLVIVAERFEPRRPSFRFSLRGAMVVVALLGVALAIHRANNPAVRYRNGDHAVFQQAVAGDRIKSGDTLRKVEAVLGAPRTPSNPNASRAAIDHILSSPSGYPDGYQEGDVFLQYWVTPDAYSSLQFRDGRLVNFDPRRFL
jgi:hypothetical protein